jgi:N-acetylglucosamine-6-phosphate deacetylase
MKTIITNATVLTPDKILKNATITIKDELIEKVAQNLATLDADATVIDAQGMYVAPGLIDIHFHGALGKDVMDADPQSLSVMAQFCLEHGVTSFYPTTWSAAPDDIFAAIDTVKEFQLLMSGAQIPGIHIEGPYINLEYRGAQLSSMIRTPDRQEYQRWFDSGIVKLVTCAPEISGGFDFIRDAVAHDIRISIGHTHAKYEEVVKAAELGATQATHLFNGMPGLHHREPGAVGGVLTDKRIIPQLICDGVHLHPAVIDLVVNTKTPSRVILITDSIRGTGLPDGAYDNKGQKFVVVDGVARTPEGGLSGSTLTLDKAVRNTMKFTHRPITEILPMATSIPAGAMGLEGRKGVIQAGADADLVFLDSDFLVERAFVQGKCLYKNS